MGNGEIEKRVSGYRGMQRSVERAGVNRVDSIRTPQSAFQNPH